MNLNDYIANIVSLAEYCDDKETKEVLLNHLTEVLNNQSHKPPCNKVKTASTDLVYQILFECYDCGHIAGLELNFIEGKQYLTSCSKCEGPIEINP